MIRELLCVFRTAAALGDHRLKTRGTHLHAAELRRNEEAVHEDQKDNQQ